MRSVYVVTHPEATHHVDGLVGGWFDSELTALGEQRAASIATELRRRIPTGLSVDVFSSDLRRTARTAEIIGIRLGVEAVMDERLREKSYGEAGGRPEAWLAERFVPPPPTGDRMGHDEGLPGAESKGEAAERIYACVESILSRDAEHQVIVTHGFAATFVLAAWIKLPLADAGYANFRTPSGSISTLVEDDYFHNRQVATLGEIAWQ